MNALTVELPDWLHSGIKTLAEQEGCTINQFLTSAAAEKMAAMKTLDYLRREAAEAKREDFERFLSAVPHRKPEETDRLPE
ncbi:MAG: toxin-antitoxin system HicB family antitoxin [Chthoniobacteraceae bacterium]